MNIQTITQTNIDGSTTDYVIIDRGNGEYTSMPKALYDTLPSESSIPTTPQAGE
jgi:hypothetical protein